MIPSKDKDFRRNQRPVFYHRVLVVTIIAAMVRTQDPCSGIYNFEPKVQVNDSCLFIPPETTTWGTAKRLCELLHEGSKLLIIDSRVKQELITSEMGPLADHTNDLWIGGQQKHSKWTWTKDRKSLSEYLGCCSPKFPSGVKEKVILNNAPALCLGFCRQGGYTEAYLRNKICRCKNGGCLSPVSDEICEHPCPGLKTETCGNRSSTYYSMYNSTDQRIPDWAEDHPFYPVMSHKPGLSCGSIRVAVTEEGRKQARLVDQYCESTFKALCEINSNTSCDRNLSTSLCFRLIDEPKNWFDARLSCTAEGGELAKIQTDSLNLSTLWAGEHYWIGLTRLHSEWHTGEDIIFRYNELNYGCLSIWFTQNSPLWTVDVCNETKQFICETRSLKVVTQTTIAVESTPANSSSNIQILDRKDTLGLLEMKTETAENTTTILAITSPTGTTRRQDKKDVKNKVTRTTQKRKPSINGIAMAVIWSLAIAVVLCVIGSITLVCYKRGRERRLDERSLHHGHYSPVNKNKNCNLNNNINISRNHDQL